MFNAENLNLKVNNSFDNNNVHLPESYIFAGMLTKYVLVFRIYLLANLLFNNFLGLNAQAPWTEESFRSPLDGTLDISGTFCEIRSHHFHTGIDIRTGGVEGKPIYAIADGYVSRINVSTYGYGKAIYITHPNGLTSVYAHLSAFHPSIHQALRSKQYEVQSWEVDFKPDSGALPVKKGQIIAYGGNTGSSLGPHLHFEIRRTHTQDWINPLLIGLPYKDTKAPQFKRLRVYASNDSMLHERKHKDYTLKLTQSGQYAIADGSTVRASGFVGLGVDVQDFQDLSGFRNDIHQMKVTAAGVLIYHIRFDSLPNAFARYSNAHADFFEYMTNSKRIHRAFRLPNLPLNNYLTLVNHGILHSHKQSTIPITVEISDFKNNTSKLVFSLQLDPPGATLTHSHQHIGYRSSHFLSLPPVTVRIPEGAFYEDVDVEFKLYDTLNKFKLPYLHLGNMHTPVHKEIDVEFEFSSLPEEWHGKLVLIHFNHKNKPRTYELRHQNQLHHAKIKDLGLFTLWPDLAAPLIYGGNMKDSSTLSVQTTLKLYIDDDLSGIRNYSCKMDNEWFLMEYEYKDKLLYHKSEGRIAPGWHRFEFQVEDMVGNRSTYTCSILFT